MLSRTTETMNYMGNTYIMRKVSLYSQNVQFTSQRNTSWWKVYQEPKLVSDIIFLKQCLFHQVECAHIQNDQDRCSYYCFVAQSLFLRIGTMIQIYCPRVSVFMWSCNKLYQGHLRANVNASLMYMRKVMSIETKARQ